MEATEMRQMDIVTLDEVRRLIDLPAGPCVSLFLPIEHAAPARQQNPLRLENLLRQAKEHLIAGGQSGAATRELLAPAYQLLEERAFLTHPAAGMALFASAALFQLYWLPLAVEELVVIAPHAHITPLLPLLSGDSPFYVLTLSLGGVQLFHGTQYGLRPVALHDVPASLEDALADDEFAKEAQFHTGVPGQGGERGAIFYGHGVRDGTVVKQEILRYFRQVDHGVHRALHDEQAPLLLAGIGYLLPIYRAVNTYPQLEEPAIVVNPDDLSPEELHARAWSIVAQQRDRLRAAAVERYQMLRGTQPALAPSHLRAIIPAAYGGRVDTLFVAAGQRRWGSFDPASGALTLHESAGPNDAELLDLAAIQTIRHGGAVYAIAPEQLPDAAPLAAILRY